MRTFITVILLLFMLLTSCVVAEKYVSDSYTINLSEFDKQGIFVTTGDFYQKYQSISIVGAVCYDGYSPKSESKESQEKTHIKKSYQDDIYTSNSFSSEKLKDSNYKTCNIKDLFDMIISQAKDQGANGIIKLEIKKISGTRQGIEIQGLAIKIEE